MKQKFYGWMPFLSPTTASQLQENADLSQNLKAAAKIKPYPRITTLNNTSKGVLNVLNRVAHTRPDARAPSVTPEGESGEYNGNVELTCRGEAIYFTKALYPFKVRHHSTTTHPPTRIPVFIFFIKPTSIQASTLEYKSKPADLFEARVGVIALSFIKTISIIIINHMFYK